MGMAIEYDPCIKCEANKCSMCKLRKLEHEKQSEGEWIKKYGFEVCSNCGATKPIAFSTVLKITYYKCDFCPRCGARMKEE